MNAKYNFMHNVQCSSNTRLKSDMDKFIVDWLDTASYQYINYAYSNMFRRYPPHAPHSRHTLHHEERSRHAVEDMSHRPRSAKSVEDMIGDPRRISSLSSTSG